jgi:hypothetical protein
MVLEIVAIVLSVIAVFGYCFEAMFRRTISNGVVVLFAFLSVTANAANETLGVECEAFQFPGSWQKAGDMGSAEMEGASGRQWLYSGPRAQHPAATAVKIPAAGTYTLWVRSRDFSSNSQGERCFVVGIGGKENAQLFGRHGKSGWGWEKGGTFKLPAGPALLTLGVRGGIGHARADALVLSPDPNFRPAEMARATGIRWVKPIPLGSAQAFRPEISAAVDPAKPEEVAVLDNEHLRVRFVATSRKGLPSVRPLIEVREGDRWRSVPADASSESYQIVAAKPDVRMEMAQFYASWPVLKEFEAGGAKVTTSQSTDPVIWTAGENIEAIPRSATKENPHTVVLEFHPTPAGTLRAHWELQSGQETAKVILNFVPATKGQFSLGYHFPRAIKPDRAEELLMPMMVQRKRFPERSFTMLDTVAPTPLSFVQTSDGGNSLTWGLAGDPSMTPFEFPTPIRSNFGMHIRSADGLVQPSIYGPIIGTPRALVEAGAGLDFCFRVIARKGGWYGAYRSVADGVQGWRDYREPGATSLTDAIYNMTDLFMDDEAGGWWKRSKAPYQIEARNMATLSTPLLPVSLYRLTGNREVYDRRALPALEFMLSRGSAHFSPVPAETDDTGYGRGSMKGPVGLFGTGSFAPLHEIMNRRTPALREIAQPEAGDVRVSKGYTHSQPFEDWLALHLLTGDQAALAEAIKQADAYIAKEITAAPDQFLGPNPFWLIEYTPAWEGLLQLYEVTGEKRFLDASAAGARLLMTGIWTQPMPPDGQALINRDGFCKGDILDLKHYRGPQKYRLGFPVQADATPEKSVPAKQVSNVGIGFEQPVTYAYRDNGGRMILQAPWSPAFLRLARHTGNDEFTVYARNAVLGRWANYPGYYLTTFTDLIQNPNYPYRGPDMTFIYYHHIPVQLSWAIDYLFSEAALLSKNAVRFPSLRQYGYAYFDSLIYGHAPGDLYGEKNVWPWLRRGLVEVKNPAFNYLTGHNEKNFHVVLMNQSREAARTVLTIDKKNVLGGRDNCRAEVIGGEGRLLSVQGNRIEVELPARGLLALKIPDVNISVPAHRQFAGEPQGSGPTKLAMTQDGLEVRAAALQIEPESWNAYVWSTADDGLLRKLAIDWTSSDGRKGTASSAEYPYELSIPVPLGNATLSFSCTATTKDGSEIHFSEKTLTPAGVH